MEAAPRAARRRGPAVLCDQLYHNYLGKPTPHSSPRYPKQMPGPQSQTDTRQTQTDRYLVEKKQAPLPPLTYDATTITKL